MKRVISTILLITTIIALFAFQSVVLAQDAVTTPDADNTVEIDLNEVGEGVENLAEGAVAVTEDAANTVTTLATDLTNRLLYTPESVILRVIFVLAGALLLLLGWRVYDELIILIGILVGAMMALAAVGETTFVVQAAAMLIGGLIGGLLAYFLYAVAVFFIGAYIGMVLLVAVASLLEITPVSAIALLIAAIAGGILMLALSFQFAIFISAFVGAQLLVLGLGLPSEWFLLLVILGIIVQLGAARYTGFDYRRRPRRRWRIS